MSRLLEDGQAVADRLEEIAFDGVISQDERQDFEDVLVFLRKLEESITDIMLIGLGRERPPRCNGKRPSAKIANLLSVIIALSTRLCQVERRSSWI